MQRVPGLCGSTFRHYSFAAHASRPVCTSTRLFAQCTGSVQPAARLGRHNFYELSNGVLKIAVCAEQRARQGLPCGCDVGGGLQGAPCRGDAQQARLGRRPSSRPASAGRGRLIRQLWGAGCEPVVLIGHGSFEGLFRSHCEPQQCLR